MPLYGRIVVIKRDGTDGAQYHLTTTVCIFGRNSDCDIRVQLPNVAKEHCRIEVDDKSGQIFLVNLCDICPTLLNEVPVMDRVEVKHRDVFTVTDRCFRVEFPPGSSLRTDHLEDSVLSSEENRPFKLENLEESGPKSFPEVKRVTPRSSGKLNDTTGIENISGVEKPVYQSTPKFPVRKTPIAARRSYSAVMTPTRAVKPETKTPLVATKNSRTSAIGVATPASKARVAGTLATRKSDLFSAEIAELKSTLLKAREKTPSAVPPVSVAVKPTTAVVKPTRTPISKTGGVAAARPKTPGAMKTASLSSVGKNPGAFANTKMSSPKTPIQFLATPGAKMARGGRNSITTPQTTVKVTTRTSSSRVHQVRKTLSPKILAKGAKRNSGGGKKIRNSAEMVQPAKSVPSGFNNLDSVFGKSFAKKSAVGKIQKDVEKSLSKNIESVEKNLNSELIAGDRPGEIVNNDLFDFAGKKSNFSPIVPARSTTRRSSDWTTPTQSSTRRSRSVGQIPDASPVLARRASRTPSGSPGAVKTLREPNSLPSSVDKSLSTSNTRKSKSVGKSVGQIPDSSPVLARKMSRTPSGSPMAVETLGSLNSLPTSVDKSLGTSNTRKSRSVGQIRDASPVLAKKASRTPLGSPMAVEMLGELDSLPTSVDKSLRTSSRRKSPSSIGSPTLKLDLKNSSPEILDFSPIIQNSPPLSDDGNTSGSAKMKSGHLSFMPRKSDPSLLRSKVNHLRRKSVPLAEESEMAPNKVGHLDAGKGIASANSDKNQSAKNSVESAQKSRKSRSPLNKGVKRPGSPLKGRPSKRCVSFGPEISPELFDRNLPSRTPLKRGSTPRRMSMSVDRVGAGLRRKSLLKNRFSSISHIEEALSPQMKSLNGDDANLTKVRRDPCLADGKISTDLPNDSALKTSTRNASILSASSTPGSQKRKIFTSGTKTTRTSTGSFTRSLMPEPELAASGKQQSSSKDLVDSFTKSAKSYKSPTARSGQPLSNVQNSKEIANNFDPFAYDSSPDSSPIKASPRAKLSLSTSYRVSLGGNKSIRGVDLEPESDALNGSKRKSISKSQENISLLFVDDIESPARKMSSVRKTPTVGQILSPNSADKKSNEANSVRRQSSASKLKSERLLGDASPEIFKSGPRHTQSLNREELLDMTSPESFERLFARKRSKSLSRRSFASLSDSSQGEESLMKSPVTGQRRSLSAEKPSSSANASGKVLKGMEFQDFSSDADDLVVKTKESEIVTPNSASSKRNSKSPRGSSVRKSILRKSFSTNSPDVTEQDQHLEVDNSEISTADDGLEFSDLKIKPRKSILRKSSSVKRTNKGGAKVSRQSASSLSKRPFDSEPRKRETGVLYQLSPEAAKTAEREKKRSKMVSERNIDLANISPMKFYKSPSNNTLKQRRSKVTPGRAVALRAVFGKSAVPSLSQLKNSKPMPSVESGNDGDEFKSSEKALNFGKTDPTSKNTAVRASKVRRPPVRVAAKKIGFVTKKRPAKAVLKTRTAQKPVGGIARKILAVRKVKSNQAIKKSDSSPTPEVIEVLVNKEDTQSSTSHASVETPSGPGEMFVSPWTSPLVVKECGSKNSSRKSYRKSISEEQDSLSKQPTLLAEAKSPRLGGLKSLLKTPKESKSPRLSGVKTMVKTPSVQKSPKLSGLKKLVKTPNAQESPQLRGLRELVKTPKIPSSPDLVGLREMVKTPLVQDSPKLSGLRNLIKTPKLQESPKLYGLKKMVNTPKTQKSPRLGGVKTLMQSPKSQKSPRLNGVKGLVKTPKVQKSPRLNGVKELVKTPKVQKSPRLNGVKELVKTPKVQKSPRLNGVKGLVKTPKVQKSPQLSGLRQLVQTPKELKSPRLGGVKNLVKTPKDQKSPDLRQLKTLFQGEKEIKTPRLDGLRSLVTVPKFQASPDFTGLIELVTSPVAPLIFNSPKTRPGTSRRDNAKKLARTPAASLISPRLSGVRRLVQTPKLEASPEFEGIRQLLQTPIADLSTVKKPRGKTPRAKNSLSISEPLDQSPLLKIDQTKSKRQTKVVKTSQVITVLPVNGSTEADTLPQNVKKTRRVVKEKHSASVGKESLESSLNVPNQEVGTGCKVVGSKRRRNITEASPAAKKRRLSGDELAVKEPSVVGIEAEESVQNVKRTRKNAEVLDVAEVDGGNSASTGKKELLSVAKEDRQKVRNSKTKTELKVDLVVAETAMAAVESSIIAPATDLPKGRRGKKASQNATDVEIGVSSSAVTKNTGRRGASKSEEVLTVEMVKPSPRTRQRRKISVASGNITSASGVVVTEEESKPSPVLPQRKGSRQQVDPETVAVRNPNTARGGRKTTRVLKLSVDTSNEKRASLETVEPASSKRGKSSKKVIEAKELILPMLKQNEDLVQNQEVSVENSSEAGRRQPGRRGRKVIISEAPSVPDTLFEATENAKEPQSLPRGRKLIERKGKKVATKDSVVEEESSLTDKTRSLKRKGGKDMLPSSVSDAKRAKLTKNDEVSSEKVAAIVDNQTASLSKRCSKRGKPDDNDIVIPEKPTSVKKGKTSKTTTKSLPPSPKNSGIAVTRGRKGVAPSSIDTALDAAEVVARPKTNARKVMFDVPQTPITEPAKKKAAKPSATASKKNSTANKRGEIIPEMPSATTSKKNSTANKRGEIIPEKASPSSQPKRQTRSSKKK